MGLLLIGLGEFICLIAFTLGIIWLILNIIRKKDKKKPTITMVMSIIVLLILVGLSGAFYSEEMEQQRIEREAKEAEERAAKESIEEEEKVSEEPKLEKIEEKVEVKTELPNKEEPLEESTEDEIVEQPTEQESEDQSNEFFYEQFLVSPDSYLGEALETTIIVSSCVNLKSECYISSEMDANRNHLKVYTETENNFDKGEYVTVSGTFEKEGQDYVLVDGTVICSGDEAKNNWNVEFSDYLEYFKENAERVTHDDLMRYPDSYREKMIIVDVNVEIVETDGILFDGKIKAQMEGGEVLINDGREVREPRIQEGDTFTLYGFGKGLATVKVKNGSGIFADTIDEYNIPEISLRYIE